MLKYSRVYTLAFIILSLFSLEAFANSSEKNSRLWTYKTIVNGGTIGIVTGGFSSTPLRIATDLSDVLDDRYNELRVLAITGKGGVHNVRDLLFLRGVDLAIVNSDILDLIAKEEFFRNVKSKISYISKLYDAEVHVVAHSRYNSLEDLRGKKVNFSLPGSSSELTGKKIFELKGIRVRPTYFDDKQALERIQKGRIAASVIISGKPVRALASVAENANLKLLPIRYDPISFGKYLPATISSKDYPGLVRPGVTVPTVATSVIIAAYNWPKDHARYKKVSRFVNSFFSNIHKLHNNSRHAKWKDVNLKSKVKGWKKFPAAAEWLNPELRKKNQLAENAALAQKRDITTRVVTPSRVITPKRTIQQVSTTQTVALARSTNTTINTVSRPTETKANTQVGPKSGVDPVVGYWKDTTRELSFKIYPCGRRFCVKSLRDGNNRNSKVVSRDIRKEADNSYSGSIYDEIGHFKYDGTVRFVNRNKIKLKGCGDYFNCISSEWIRIGSPS